MFIYLKASKQSNILLKQSLPQFICSLILDGLLHSIQSRGKTSEQSRMLGSTGYQLFSFPSQQSLMPHPTLEVPESWTDANHQKSMSKQFKSPIGPFCKLCVYENATTKCLTVLTVWSYVWSILKLYVPSRLSIRAWSKLYHWRNSRTVNASEFQALSVTAKAVYIYMCIYHICIYISYISYIYTIYLYHIYHISYI